MLPGVYHENVRVIGKNIRIISSKGADSTVLISASGGSPIVLLDGTNDFSRFEGFTVESGGITIGVPAAILLQNSSGYVQNNVIQNISGVPAIRTQGESPKIISNVLRLNAGNRLIEFVSVNPLLQRNLIVENRNDWLVYVVDSFLAINNTIANNSGPYGIFFTGTNAGSKILNNIFANLNTGVSGGSYAVTMSYNDFFQVTVPSTDPLDTGNIFTDPLFKGGQPFDYSLERESPCVDAGDPGTPIPPGGGSRVDIGAFEFVPNRGDLDRDGMFSPADVVLELNCIFLLIGDCPLEVADLNCDGQLSPADVVLLLNLVFLGILPPC
ncbi:MAG TPA: right-handed parallel beta-helix repeat-containing protein [Verrucomicrobiae bacterium]|nr:right-handed parallel beta-helix repeat-containing protein [Verrucomicrobiae bacterium]